MKKRYLIAQLKRWKHPFLVLGGILSLLGPPGQSWGATNTDANVTLTVRPFAGVPPSSVNTLSVSPGTAEGQIRLDWTAPNVFPGSSLDSYQIRVQTFSLASVGGSTTTWWNAPGGILIQGLYGESPGAAVTRTLGPPGSGSLHTAALYAGATYYAAVRSADDVGVPRDFWSTVTQVSQGSALDLVPGTPTGFAAAVSSAAVTLSWTDLPVGQKGIDFDQYRLYRSNQPTSNFVVIASTTATSYVDTSVISGFAYYYRLTAVDRGLPAYPGTALESAPTATVSASLGAVGNLTPLRPNGLTMSASAGQFTLTWHPVTTATNGQPLAIDHYVVYRYDTIGSSATAAVPVLSTSYTDTVGGLTYFYRVVAVAAGGALSAASDYVDSSADLNRYALAPTETDTRITLPAALAEELNFEFNGTTDDYEIVAIHQPQNENTTTLKAYLFQVQNARTGQIVSNFSFSRPIAAVQVSYALNSGGVIGLRPSVSSLGNDSAQAQAVAQLISLYWFNGSTYIRLGGTVVLQNQALTVAAKNLGLYEIRAVSQPTSFGLTRGSPYPRIITPNGAENRRVFWFYDNPSAEEVTGTIYDIRGAKVRDLVVNGMSPTPNSLVWDGKDDRGAVVPSGVYLYKIQAGKERQTGTVVVAR